MLIGACLGAYEYRRAFNCSGSTVGNDMAAGLIPPLLLAPAVWGSRPEREPGMLALVGVTRDDISWNTNKI